MKRFIPALLIVFALLCSGNRVANKVASTSTGLKTSLSAYYALDEASGDALDSSGNGYTATQNGTCGAGSGGPIGNYRTFNGSDTWFESSDAIFLPGSSSFSCAGWFYATSMPQVYPALFGVINGDGSHDSWGVLLDYTNSKPYAAISSNGTADTNAVWGTTASAGAWHYAVMVWDGTNEKFSFDGGAFVTAAFTGPVYSFVVPFKIGRLSSGTNFNGRMQGVAYWKGRALTITDVGLLYNSGSGLPYTSW